jgi:DNA replication protein DnaC
MMHYPFHEEYRDAHMSKIIQNEEVMNKLMKWFENPEYIFYFTGKIGTGKTYFVSAIYNRWIEEKKNVRAYTESNFLSHLKTGFKDNIDSSYEIKRLCDCDIFILDDMGHSRINEWQKDMLFEFIDIRSSMKRPTLITSNLSKKDISSAFDDRLASRLYASRNTIVYSDGEDRRSMINFGKSIDKNV